MHGHRCGPSDHYGLVVDAGSSGTRLRIYCWPPPSRGALPRIADALHLSTAGLGIGDPTLRRRPGLSAFAHSPELALEQVLSLIDEARRWVPQDRSAAALLYVKATAGLRLLPARQAESLLQAVSGGLSNRTRCPFSFVDARVISGEEEALFGWLSVNHLLGRLDRAMAAHQETVAWLDLGGASAQIAHMLQPGSTTSEENAARVLALPNSNVRLVLRSHLRFGRDEAFWRSCRLLARRGASGRGERSVPHPPRDRHERAREGNDSRPAQLAHPCLHEGDEVSFRYEQGVGASQQLAQVDFFGTGDAAECQEVVGVLVHQEDDCPPGRCGKLTKPFPGTFYGAGNYFYVARLLQLASPTGTAYLSADDFSAAARRACGVPWAQTRAAWNASEWQHVRFGCFSALYISGLMQHEYSFPRSSRRLAIAHNLRGSKVEWALGSMLHELALKDIHEPALVPDAAGWLHGCRAMLRDGMVPFWCLLPVSWAVALGLVTWLVGCACLHQRLSLRRGGGTRVEPGRPSTPEYLSDSCAEMLLSNSLRKTQPNAS